LRRRALALSLGTTAGKSGLTNQGKRTMANSLIWTTPILVEICIGLEINGYLPAEF
jgi:coenzyme PQQ precursor peptide PqqA